MPYMAKPRYVASKPKRPWYVEFNDLHSGKRRTKTFVRQEDAWEFYSTHQRQKRDLECGRIDPDSLDTARRSAIPLEDSLEEYKRWMTRQAMTAPHVNGTHRLIERCIESCQWKTSRDITLPTLEKWLGEFGAATANHYGKTIQTFCAWLMKQHYLSGNPVAELNTRRAEVTIKKRAMTFEEFRRLIHCEKVASHRRLWYWMCGRLGLRQTELSRLTWSCLDFEHRDVVITPTIGKVNRTDRVPIPAQLLDTLKSIRQAPATPVFKTKPQRRAFYNDLDRADIQRETDAGTLVLSSLRKTFVTHLIQSGVNETATQKAARHRHRDLTVNVYTDEALLGVRAAIDGLDEERRGDAI